MLSLIHGNIIAKDEQSVTIDVHSLGLELFVPDVSKVTINQEITLFTYVHWNQEQGPSLFGFLTIQEKKIFLMIIKCHGIGPKLALSILAHCPISIFLKAIQRGDVTLFTDIPGIGKKKAEQLIIALKDKVVDLLQDGFAVDEKELLYWKELVQALESLHYSKQEIAQALDAIKSEPFNTATFDQLLRKSLSYLAKRK